MRNLITFVLFLSFVPVASAKPKTKEHVAVEVISVQAKIFNNIPAHQLIGEVFYYGETIFGIDQQEGKHVIYVCVDDPHRCQVFASGTKISGDQTGNDVRFTLSAERKGVRYKVTGSW